MLVHYFVDIDLPMARVEEGIRRCLGELDGWAADAYRKGEEVRARIGLSAGPLTKEVVLELGEPTRGSESVTYPVSWRATGAATLFPTMDAEIVLAPMGAESTHLTFQGRYQPPLAAVGYLLDRAALHRVAEATVKYLVDGLTQGVIETTSGSTSQVRS